ncbi:hypothetical protein A2U01_0032334 [Trifolium medium]|uniref:Uncharacterized protein n=1 Tax=Trifolium medium TaxID=97028 RepID=A0A392PHG8_9FABA|nr:hypothetical protein [Trifolium medium]
MFSQFNFIFDGRIKGYTKESYIVNARIDIRINTFTGHPRDFAARCYQFVPGAVHISVYAPSTANPTGASTPAIGTSTSFQCTT